MQDQSAYFLKPIYAVLIDEENEEQQELEFALPSKRIFVALIDVVNCWILSYAFSYLFPDIYDHLLYSASILLMTTYKIYAEKTGLQTFGKMIYRIEAKTSEGKELSWSNVLRRNSFWMLLLLIYVLYYYVLIPKYGVALSEYPFVFTFINTAYTFRLVLLLILADMAFIFITPKKQALHDIFADTIVVDKQ